MGVKNLLMLGGGIALFMYGMYQMGGGLTRLAEGGRLKGVLQRATGSPIRAVLVGAGVTAVIQSSSATTVMVVQLVDTGIVGLEQAAGIIMGANVGTCATAWLLGAGEKLGGIMVLMWLGAAYFCVVKSRKWEDASFLFGFALLLCGMRVMEAGTAPLAKLPTFQRMLTQFENPLHGVAAGALFTAVIQSSSASVGILQALSGTGAVRYSVAIPVILGQNIGTCVTALLSCIGVGRNGRRAAMLHLWFNLVGVGTFLPLLLGMRRFWGVAFLDVAADAWGIALVHTAFNVMTTAVCIPILHYGTHCGTHFGKHDRTRHGAHYGKHYENF